MIMTTDVLVEKCGQLNPLERQTVGEFIDFLLSKHTLSRGNAQQALLDVSVWSEDDVTSIERVQQDMAQWQIPTFS